jgi:hypothetical protein
MINNINNPIHHVFLATKTNAAARLHDLVATQAAIQACFT